MVLDRCRPSYAIDFLETIKHLFNQENTAFVISTNLSQLKSSAKALFGNELDFNNYYRKFSATILQLPRTDKTAEPQYEKIFSAFLELLESQKDIKNLIKDAIFNENGVIKKYISSVADTDLISLRGIKSVFYCFFNVIKILEITKVDKTLEIIKKGSSNFAKCYDYQISIQQEKIYIHKEALKQNILSTILAIILYKELTPHYKILQYNSSSYNKTHETDSKLSKLAQNAEHCLKSMAILQDATNLLDKSIIYAIKNESQPNSYYYTYELYQSYYLNHKNTESKVKQLSQDQSIIKDQVELIYNTLKTLIESGFSARQKQ